MNCNSRNIIDVRYEDFTSNPEREISRIMGFLGLEVAPHQLDPRYYSKNRMSQKSEFQKLNSEITSSSNKRWLADMSEKEQSKFVEISSPELTAFNYEIGSRGD